MYIFLPFFFFFFLHQDILKYLTIEAQEKNQKYFQTGWVVSANKVNCHSVGQASEMSLDEKCDSAPCWKVAVWRVS